MSKEKETTDKDQDLKKVEPVNEETPESTEGQVTITAVRSKLSSIEWDAVKDHFDAERRKACDQLKEEYKEICKDREDVLTDQVEGNVHDHYRKNYILIPANEDVIAYFNRAVEQRINSTDTPEQTRKDIATLMVKSVLM